MKPFVPALIHAPGDVLPRPHGNCYWLISGHLLAGEYPAADEPSRRALQMQALLDAGVTHCIDLTHESEALPGYSAELKAAALARQQDLQVHRHSVADFGVPSQAGMRLTLDHIEAAWSAGGLVYLHCRGGIGRTGTVAGCLLREQGLSGDEALALIHTKWQVMAKRAAAPHSPETPEQRRFIRAWVAGSVR